MIHSIELHLSVRTKVIINDEGPDNTQVGGRAAKAATTKLRTGRGEQLCALSYIRRAWHASTSPEYVP
jgi:hypothetical protein